jgi:hypothetical protein
MRCTTRIGKYHSAALQHIMAAHNRIQFWTPRQPSVTDQGSSEGLKWTKRSPAKWTS